MNQNLADDLVMMMREDQHLLEPLFVSGEQSAESYHPRMKALQERKRRANVAKTSSPHVALG